MRSGSVGSQRGVGPERQPLEAVLDDDICVFVTFQIILVIVMCYGSCLPRRGHRQTRVADRPAAVGGLAGAAGDSAAADDVVALVHWLYGHDQVVAVGNHHVRDLIQRLPCNLNAINLQHLIINCQQPGALRQASGDHPGYEDAWDLLQPVRSYTDTGPVADVEAQGFVRAVAIETDAAMRLGQDVDIDDRGDGTEVMRHSNGDAGTLTVDVAVAKGHYSLLLTG